MKAMDFKNWQELEKRRLRIEMRKDRASKRSTASGHVGSIGIEKMLKIRENAPNFSKMGRNFF